MIGAANGDSLLLASDLLLRGGVCMLLVLLAVMMLRDHGRTVAGRLGAFFAIGTAAYAICSAAGIDARLGLWALPIMALATGNNLSFWLFTRSLFDDGFRPRVWHAALWLAIVASGIVEGRILATSQGLRAELAQAALSLSALAFAALAVVQTIGSWPADLVERRRRLRLFIVAAGGGYIALTAVAQLAGLARAAPAAAGALQALGLAVIAGVAACALLQVSGGEALFPQAEAERPKAAAPPPPEPADIRLAAALERRMTEDKLYRQDRLSIGALAQRLGVPEYRLRRLINQHLRHRNFNSFLNGYRLAEAKAALADPGQAGVPILTIALDAGFSSLGPFNRAFKAETGLTPTEFRRRDARPEPKISISAGRIPNSA